MRLMSGDWGTLSNIENERQLKVKEILGDFYSTKNIEELWDIERCYEMLRDIKRHW